MSHKVSSNVLIFTQAFTLIPLTTASLYHLIIIVVPVGTSPIGFGIKVH